MAQPRNRGNRVEQVSPVEQTTEQNVPSQQENPIMPETETAPVPDQTVASLTTPSQRDIIDPLDPACPISDLVDRYTDEERRQIRAAFDRGLITRERVDVTISAQSANLPTDQKQPYWAYCPTGVDRDLNGEPVDAIEGMKLLSNGKVLPATPWKDRKATTDEEKAQKERDETKGVVDHWFYGYDLAVRSSIRTYLSGLIAGPAVEIGKAVKAMFVNKLADTKEEAFETVMAIRRKRNLPVPDGLTLESLKINWK